MAYIKVKDKNNLYRDLESNGIINGDNKGYQQYLDVYKRRYNETKKIQEIESDINHMKNDLTEIKTLLRNLFNESE